MTKEEITEEELLFIEIPIVVTAARKEQPVTESPATVTVITADEIKKSGALSIPDVICMISGVDVMTLTARDQQVGIRGFNSPLSNKVLVMIDGRSVYLDMYGNVLWDLFPVSLEEIERIEIIKSPISCLYGANAYSGIINIITKSPEKIKGTEINLTGGEQDTFISSILHAGTTEKIIYKVSATFDRTNEWNRDERAGDIVKGNFLLGYKIAEENKLSLSGGRSHFEDKKLFTMEEVGTIGLTGNIDYLQIDYEYSKLKFRAFLKREEADTEILRPGKKTDDLTTTLTTTCDTELMYSLNLGNRHSLILGANYRYNTIEKDLFIPEDHTQSLWALFLEDEISITDKLRLTLGGRYDGHPLVKEHFSPRGTLSYSPLRDHTVRLSVANAYRNPTFVDSYHLVE